MTELTVLMCWHNDPDAEKRQAYLININSFIINNPRCSVIPIPNKFEHKEKAWLSSDLNIFMWYIEEGHQLKTERFLLVEWDCWCNCNLFEYYNRVWDCEVVGPSVYYPNRDYWNWFKSIVYLPARAKNYATGIVPFNGILLSKNAMDKISREILKPEFDYLNSEMRLATVAAMLNMEPVVNPVSNRNISWKENDYHDFSKKTLHHPVKKPFFLMQKENL